MANDSTKNEACLRGQTPAPNVAADQRARSHPKIGVNRRALDLVGEAGGAVIGALIGMALIRIIDAGMIMSHIDAKWFKFAIGTLTILAVIANAWLSRAARRIRVEAAK